MQPQSPLNPQAPRPETTPLPGQPLQSQGMPTGQDPTAMPGQEFVSPEERQQLVDLLNATKDKRASLRTAEYSSGNSEDAAKLDALRELFSLMQSAGVDLTSVESVNAFIEKIKTTNPNMAADFEESLEFLLGEEPMNTGEIPQDINVNETLQEGVRGPSERPQPNQGLENA